MDTLRKSLLLLSAFAIAHSAAFSQSQTPPMVSVGGNQGTNDEGTFDNPFSGSGISLLLQISDPDRTFYAFSWTASWSGNFCNRNFQWFGTESWTPNFLFPRVRSGVASVTIRAHVTEPPHQTVTGVRTFYIVPHPDGCPGENDPDQGAPDQLVLVANPSSATFGQTISLTASAEDSDDNSLTMLYYASTSSNPANKGVLIGTKSATGCKLGCSSSINFQVATHATVHYLLFEAKDNENTVASQKIAVQVSASGGGGNGPPPPPPPPPGSPVECVECQSTVDAGPPTATVVGGNLLPLDGEAVGPAVNNAPVPGVFRWNIVDDGGLGSALRFTNAIARTTALQAPDVNEDTVVTIEFSAEFNACGCVDEMVVTILAQEPPEADLVIEASAPSLIERDQDLTYVLNVTNNGPDLASNVTVTNVLPDGLQYLSSTTSRGSCSRSGDTVTCNLGSLEDGDVAQVTVRTRPTRVGQFFSNATVASNEEDPSPGNNSSSAFTEVEEPGADLSLEKRGPESKVNLGGELSYDLIVRNLGDKTAAGATVIDNLPEALQYVGALPSQGSCLFLSSSNSVICQLGALDAGAQANVLILTRALEVGSVVNTASVSTADDPDPSNNQDSATTLVEDTQADLRVSIALGGETLRVDEPVNITITIVNEGPQSAEAVSMTHLLPLSLGDAITLPSKGSCTLSEERLLDCQLGSFEVGEEVTVRINGLAVEKGDFELVVEVMGGGGDPDSTNNRAEMTFNIEAVDFFTILPYSLRLENTFVSLASVNMSGGPNALEVQGLDQDGQETSLFEGDANADLSQEAFLTTEVSQGADTLIVRGSEGRVRSFFMMGAIEGPDVTKLDGIGGRMPDSETLYFPVAQRNEERDSTFFVYNPGRQSDPEVSFALMDADGQELASTTMALMPLGSFQGTFEELFPGFTLDAGSVRVQGTGSLRGFVLASDGTNFISLTGQPGLETRKLIVPHFLALPAGTTILTLLNLSSQQTNGTVHVLDDNGNELAASSFNLSGSQLLNLDLKVLFDFDELNVGTGSLELRLSRGNPGISSDPAHVVAAVRYETERFSAALPMVEEGRQSTFFLHVAQSALHRIFHGLAILNSSDAVAQGQVEVYDKQGQITASMDFTLQPGQRIVDLLNGALFFGEDFEQVQGHIRVTADQKVIAFSLFGGEDRFLAAIEGQGIED